MRAVLQRVKKAAVRVSGETVGEIAEGIVALVGFTTTDTVSELEWMAQKIRSIRIFPDASGKMNLSVEDIHGGILIVSQFTLYGELRKGTRPNFQRAAPAEKAEQLYAQFLSILKTQSSCPVESGIFGAMMEVELINSGPVTIVLEREARRSDEPAN